MNNKAKICLNAMVGNESATILRMLESVAPHIDYWVIQCNGKEDNTSQIINEFLTNKEFLDLLMKLIGIIQDLIETILFKNVLKLIINVIGY